MLLIIDLLSIVGSSKYSSRLTLISYYRTTKKQQVFIRKKYFLPHWTYNRQIECYSKWRRRYPSFI